jgi:hypothetical protein
MPKLTNEDIEEIEKTLTKTWSMHGMEARRYQEKMRNNSYKWLTELVAEVKYLRLLAADPTPPVQPDITQRAGKYFIVSVKDEGFHLQSDEGEEVHYILIDINGRMEGYSDDLKEIESIYGRVTRIPGEVITDDQR